MSYIVQADIEARVSARVLRQVYDDDRAGVAQAAAIAQLIEDAESFVEEIVSGTYDIVEVRAASPVLSAMKRLCLDAAVAYLRERWPSHMKTLTAKSWERLKSECKEVELACRRINPAGETSGPANVGGTIDPGVPAALADQGIYQQWGFGNTGSF
jgi:phage gp36-like protein